MWQLLDLATVRATSHALFSDVPLVSANMADSFLERNAVRSHQQDLLDYSFLIIISLSQCCLLFFVNILVGSLYKKVGKQRQRPLVIFSVDGSYIHRPKGTRLKACF